MNKKLITLAVAVAMATPVAVMAEAVMYGKVRQAVDYVDNEMTGEDEWRVTDYASRIGVKGSEDLGNGLKAVYKMEWGVNISNTNDGNGREFGQVGDSIYNRNAYVGLAGDWGTFLVGRHDTPLKISTGSLDYFSDQAGDYNLAANGGFADRRADGTAAYISPNMAGFTVAAAIVPGENADADGMTDAYSVAAMYSNSGFFASAAYEAGDSDIDDLSGIPADLDQMRFGLGYDGGVWKIAAVYENMELDGTAPGVGDFDQDRWILNGAYNFGNSAIKAKYFDADETVDGWVVGFDHNFSKRTQFQATYSDSSWDNGLDTTVFSLGMNHEF